MTRGTRDADGLRVDEAFRCGDCENEWYYTRNRCPDCQSATFSTYRLREGELVAYTTVNVTPPDVRSANVLGLAAFGDVRLIAQMSDDDPEVGDSVRFAGQYELREGGEKRARLTGVDGDG
ncbi:hypothetical protein LPA44_17740 [Halobacterium sp. KA-4]|uniref:Zn-ribbon domain-containing OB-fold protein n=1 Tax=Halobacterium sp. KA-4 TaxID=2896367 RepID=UPI001E55CA09|nr:hypothetical protein [Halobacterium sp. KA-4]MCD2201705.1 hypothetical protein [Halobacterium sp. KA-4]